MYRIAQNRKHVPIVVTFLHGFEDLITMKIYLTIQVADFSWELPEYY